MTTSLGQAGAGQPHPPERHFCKTLVAERVGGRKAALLNANQWQLGETIKIRFLEGDAGLRDRVKAAANAWTGPSMANLNLVYVDDDSAEVRITFQQGAGSWSYIGTECRSHPGEATINFGWLTPESSDNDVKSVVLHEFGHMLGLIHEHQNPNSPINWNRSAVIADLSGPPNNWDQPTIEFNIFDPYDKTKLTTTILDPKSIMMYQIPAAWTTDGFSTEFNGDLSPLDKQLIAQVYPT
ncbi:MAG: hypothetical protein JWM87_3179 [Candidatus Eremiobacteraeota bacterium]|nr:hypothetical protein [Candidatus Eremiobacteraeota bacterium]